MNEEDTKWYEDQFELFSTAGYKALVSKVKEIADNLDTLRNTSTESALQFKKGQLDILDWLAGWEGSVEATYKDLNNENVV